MSEERIAELEDALAAEFQARANLQRLMDRYAIDIPEYRHALDHVVDCEANCEQCRTLAGATLDRTTVYGIDETSPVASLSSPWRVQMVRQDDGSFDIGLELTTRAMRLSWEDAVKLSVALKVAVENATPAHNRNR